MRTTRQTLLMMLLCNLGCSSGVLPGGSDEEVSASIAALGTGAEKEKVATVFVHVPNSEGDKRLSETVKPMEITITSTVRSHQEINVFSDEDGRPDEVGPVEMRADVELKDVREATP